MTERNLDFDRIINRKNTDCLKYDFAVKRGMPADVLPLWVADMDFETSSYIEDALVERAKMGIYGYSDAQTPYFEAVAGWMKRHHNWEPKEEWLIKTPGVVFALAMAVKAYTAPGDAVLIQSPVYYPFSEVIADNGRRVVSSTLVLSDDNRYHMDVADFEEKLKAENVKLFFLCNPHNPVGRVWTKEELTAIGDLCVQYNVTVVSDEIHGDFIFKGEHQVFAAIKKEYEELLIIADVCLCEYTSHGHCGLVKDGVILNDETLPLLAKASVSYAKAGADIIAPSDMMDLRVKAIREALDEAGFVYTPIMSYSAKFASGYYGPFRDAAHSAPGFGDRKTYQMDPANSNEAMIEADLDIAEGADIIMVKPALSYLDIIRRFKDNYDLPIAAYNVSGEYSMLKEAVKKGLLSEDAIYEAVMSIKRAGATIIITYFAKDIAKLINTKK